MTGTVHVLTDRQVLDMTRKSCERIRKLWERAHALGERLSKLCQRIAEHAGDEHERIVITRDTYLLGASGLVKIDDPRNLVLTVDPGTRIVSVTGDAILSYVNLTSGAWTGTGLREIVGLPLASWYIIADDEIAKRLLMKLIPHEETVRDVLQHVDKMREEAREMLRLAYSYRKTQKTLGVHVVTPEDIEKLLNVLEKLPSLDTYMIDACYYIQHLEKYLEEYCNYAEKLVKLLEVLT